jgi:inner membrane transporter RhtA
VAVLRSENRRNLIWPVIAFGGVLLLTEPWTGQIDWVGVLFAAIAATGWAGYILLTQVVGDRFSGIDGLAITIPIAALATTFIGLPQAWGNITPWVLVQAVGLALLLPVIPFTLELQALRRLTTAAFGTLMALEPAMATMWGVVLLAQVPQATQFLGVALVVVAGIGAERSGRRAPVPATPMA